MPEPHAEDDKAREEAWSEVEDFLRQCLEEEIEE